MPPRCRNTQHPVGNCTASPTVVYPVAGTKLLQLLKIDDQARTVTVTISLSLQWWDPLAKYFYDDLDINELWYLAPFGTASVTAAQSAIKTNIIDDDYLYVNSANQKAGVPVALEYRVTRRDVISNSQSWQMYWFPFDHRTIKLEYTLPSHDPLNVAYVFGPAGQLIVAAGEQELSYLKQSSDQAQRLVGSAWIVLSDVKWKVAAHAFGLHSKSSLHAGLPYRLHLSGYPVQLPKWGWSLTAAAVC